MRKNIGEDEVNDVDLSTEGQETPAVVQQNNTPKNRKLPKNLRKIKHFIDNHPNETFTISEIAKKTKMDYAKVYGYYKRGSLIEYENRIILPGAERTIETEPEISEETYQEKMRRIQEERKQYAEADKEREESIKMGNIEPEKKTDIKEEIKSEEKEEEIKQVEIKEEVKPEEKRGETMKEKTKSETTKDNSVILPTMGTNMGIPISLNSTNVKITGMPETKEKILENLEEEEPIPNETDEDFEPTEKEMGRLIPKGERRKVEEPKDKISLSNTVQLPIGCSTEVWTITGRRSSGKSYSCGKIVEELKRLGIQFVILDPRGAHSAISIENVKHLSPTPGKTINMKLFVNTLKVKPALSVIINLKNLPLKEQQPIIRDYCEEMLLADFKRPFMTVFEEIQDFTPLKRRTEASDSLIRYIKLGRSSGYGAILVTQRPASASKEALSQSGIYIVHKVINTKDLQALEDLISFGLRKDKEIVRGILSKVTQFSAGEMVLYAPDYIEENNGVLLGKTGKRKTMHAGVNVPVVPGGAGYSVETFDESGLIPSENIHYPGKDEKIGGTSEEDFREIGEEISEEPSEGLETEGIEEGETGEPEETPVTVESLKEDEGFRGALGIIGGLLAGLATYFGLKHFTKK